MDAILLYYNIFMQYIFIISETIVNIVHEE